MSATRRNNRYSLAFKQKVVSEIESGKFSLSQVRRIYDIGGGGTVYQWLRTLGKGHLIDKIIRIEMKDEKDKLKELQQKNQQLESALAQTQLKLLVSEALLESVEAHYKIDVKKTFGLTASSARPSKPKKKG